MFARTTARILSSVDFIPVGEIAHCLDIIATQQSLISMRYLEPALTSQLLAIRSSMQARRLRYRA